MTARMFPRVLQSVLALALIALASGASAHGVKETETMLGDRELYFQAVDKPAPDFTLRDATGNPVKLADLRGKIVVLHFIYATCTDVCPLQSDKIAEVQEMVNITPMREQVQFVSITTDPSKDTADVLQAYGPLHGLAPGNWRFLTTAPGQPEDFTRALAQKYGHKFQPTEDGAQVHGVVTHVIDQSGRWRANFHGLRFESVNLVLYLNALSNDHEHPAPSWWERLKALF